MTRVSRALELHVVKIYCVCMKCPIVALETVGMKKKEKDFGKLRLDKSSACFLIFDGSTAFFYLPPSCEYDGLKH